MEPAVTVIDTPLGPYVLAAGEEGLVRVAPGRAAETGAAAAPASRRHVERAARALRAYFEGERPDLVALPRAAPGRPFERRVWRALCEIPYGATRSYGEVARRLGAPGAARAVGAANRRNPLAILVPCHRVIGADGALTGYAGGLARKRWLLAHEAAR